MILTIPDLVIDINGPMIAYFMNSTSLINLDSSASYDPMGLKFTTNWDCPSYFGGDSCSTAQILSFTQ
jgi:hypothetical protein